MAIGALYVLAALVRLAYFNVTEAERKTCEGGVRVSCTRFPVTSAAVLFPALQYLTKADIAIGYFRSACGCSCFFTARSVEKLYLKSILILIAIGIAEFMVILLGQLL